MLHFLHFSKYLVLHKSWKIIGFIFQVGTMKLLMAELDCNDSLFSLYNLVSLFLILYSLFFPLQNYQSNSGLFSCFIIDIPKLPIID